MTGTDLFLLVLGWIFVIEGLSPLINPVGWQRMLAHLAEVRPSGFARLLRRSCSSGSPLSGSFLTDSVGQNERTTSHGARLRAPISSCGRAIVTLGS